MNRDEQGLIRDLFGRMAELEARGPARDGEAEAFIARALIDQPGAPYYMAQTIIVQTEALKAAEERIRALEAERDGDTDGAPERETAGAFGGIFGRRGRTDADAPVRRRSVPSVGQRPAASGGGFLAGAAQTALGVAGGVFLGSMIGSLFGSTPAEAGTEEAAGGEPPPDAGNEASEADAGDAGGDFGDFGGFDIGGDF